MPGDRDFEAIKQTVYLYGGVESSLYMDLSDPRQDSVYYNIAAGNVQNRVTTVLDELPEEVIRAGVITEKEVNSMLMYLNIRG